MEKLEIKTGIALDVDGVLANFYLAICRYAGMPYNSLESWGEEWIFKALSKVRNDSKFWLTLPMLNPPEAITFDFDCYLSAYPEGMYEMRKLWLQMNGYPDKPLIRSTNKLKSMLELGLTTLIDDRPETINKINGTKELIGVTYLPCYASWENTVENVHCITTHLPNALATADFIVKMRNLKDRLQRIKSVVA